MGDDDDNNVGCCTPRPVVDGSSSSSSESTTTTTPHLKVYQAFVLATPILITFVLLFLFLLICLRRHCLLILQAADSASHVDHNNSPTTTATTTTTTTRRSSLSRFIPSTLFAVPRRGLKKSIRDGLPVIIYNEKLTTTSSSSTSATGLMDNQCVVCLGDYQKNETLQQLPVCSHIFHKACVDEWLANNSTCPLCRMSLLLFPTQKNSNNNNIIMKSSSSSSPPQPSSQLQQLPRSISNRNLAAAHEERISTFPTPSTI